MNKFVKYAAPVAAVAVAGSALAGTGGAEFSDLKDLFEGWSTGILGRILAVGALLIGIAFGLVRQSVIAAVVGIAVAVVLSYGPTVISNIVTATAAGASAAQVASLGNGML